MVKLLHPLAADRWIIPTNAFFYKNETQDMHPTREIDVANSSYDAGHYFPSWRFAFMHLQYLLMQGIC